MYHKNFSFHDGCNQPFMGKRNKQGKWEIYNISKSLGMGLAEYDTRVTNLEYDNLLDLHIHSPKGRLTILGNGSATVWIWDASGKLKASFSFAQRPRTGHKCLGKRIVLSKNRRRR